MSRMKDVIVQLREENAALRTKCAEHAKFRKEWIGDNRGEALDAVCHNLRHLHQDNRERVLMAAAVLYGIVKPLPADVPRHSAAKEKP